MNGNPLWYTLHSSIQSFLCFIRFSLMRICCFAIAGAGPGMRCVLLQLQVWCSCIPLCKRASSALLNMISVTVAGRSMWRVTLWGAIDNETEELQTIAQWMEILYGIHCIPQNNLFFGSLDSVWHANMLLCNCRGGCLRLLCFMSGHKMSIFVKQFGGKLNSALYRIYSGCLQRACSSRKCMFWIGVSCTW